MQSNAIRDIIDDLTLAPETRDYIESLLEVETVDDKTVELIMQILADEADMYQELSELAAEEATIFEDLQGELDVIGDEAELEIETARAEAYEEATKAIKGLLTQDPSQPAAWAQ